MPAIIKDIEQENALKTIGKTLKEVENCNAEILSASGVCSFGIDKYTVNVTDKYAKEVKSILRKHRKDLVRTIVTLCNKYRIALDESEEFVISDEVIDRIDKNKATADAEPVGNKEFFNSESEEEYDSFSF